MNSRMSRRELAGLAAAAARAAAQTPAAPPATTPPADDLASVRAQMKRNFEQMTKTELPMSTEPAVHFRA